MTRLILLARHGAHDEIGRVLSGRSEIPLNEAGRRQADALAAHLAGMGLAQIWSSPRARCVQTAAPIAAANALPVDLARALDEIDFGAFAGQAFDRLAPDPRWQDWNAARDTARCPGGETMAEAVGRLRAFLLDQPPERAPTLCVTHCDLIRGLAAAILGIGLERLLDLPCDPGSITTVAIEERTLRLVTLNERAFQPEAP